MIWKFIAIILIFILFSVILFIGYIVWNNRASEKILTNVTSAFILGTIGLLATSLISLKEEKNVDTYSSCILVQKQPLFLMHSCCMDLKSEKILPVVFTNNAINNLLKKDSLHFEKIFENENNKKLFFEKLFIRYIIDLLDAKYHTGWFMRTYEHKVPGGFQSSSFGIELLDNLVYDEDKLNHIFEENEIIKIGKNHDFKNPENSLKYSLFLPPETKLTYKFENTLIYSIQLNNSSVNFSNIFININNSFVEIEIKIKYTTALDGIDKEIANAFKIKGEYLNNYTFTPFLIETTTKFKKMKIGHPDMEKYKYWANDLLSYLKYNISVDEFWKLVKMNQ